jgi:flagellin
MTNVASLNSQRQLNKSQASLNTSLERLSSGLRINSAKDDAAGLAISQRMTSQISGMNVAVRNANDGISLAQTAEGTLSAISDNLQRMRELAVQSANASNSSTDRIAIQQEVSQLAAEIDRVATQTDFNGTKLLDGSFAAQQFQVGANVGQTITVTQIDSARTSALGQFTGFQLQNQSIGTASDTAAGQSITVGTTTTSLGTIANDGKALAAAMNASGISGLTATANATSLISATAATAATTAGTTTLAINGTTLTIAATTNAATNRANAVAAINAQSTVTGVSAKDNGTGIDLTALDGRNITVGTVTAGTAGGVSNATFGLAAAATTGSTVNITYQAAKGTTGNVSFTGAFTAGGAQAIGVTGTSINAIDVTTQSGANTAITSIDAALASVNSSKANLGAIQNRFTSVVANLQSSSENLSASRSRIQDADFAAETANMSKANILQQAGTAMLAQANSAPQNVLSLLK